MRYLWLFVLVGCGDDPLAKGTWIIERTGFTNDTCGFTAEDAAVGERWEAELSWDGDDIVLEGFQADTTYENQGEYWEAASDSSRETDVCVETFDEEHHLVLVDERTFTIDAQRRLGKSGACDGVETPAPCGYDLTYSGAHD